MILTQERVVPKLMNPKNGMLREHIARYKFAKRMAFGRVFDIACGVGYGTSLILDENDKVEQFIGVDIDEKSIQYAQINYPHKKAEYLINDVLSPSLPDKLGFFDTIISFETIEHVEDDEIFIKNLHKLLKPSGILIISTPFGRGRGIPCSNPFHVHQYKEEEFTEILSCFGEVDMYYQLDEAIEKRIKDKKYYLMVAVCKH